MEQARGFFRKIIELVKKPELRILPGQLAFFLVLSLIPLVALIGTIFSSFSVPVNTIKSILINTMPEGVTEIIMTVISGRGFSLNFNMVAFLIMAFVLASNGTHSMIITSNEIYKIKSQTIIRRRLKAILMTFILVMLFFFLLIIPIYGDIIFFVLKEVVSNNIPINFLYKIYQLIEYPLIILILYYNIKTIYIIAPDEKIESITTTKGAIFTSVGWILASEIYSFYVSNFSNYDMLYGSLSNVVVLLLWVYILSYIFVLGMILNAGNFKENVERKVRLQKERTENKTKETEEENKVEESD